MAKVDLKISFECPACKQINEGASFGKAINVEATNEYFGKGRYGDIDSVTVTCSGCKVETEIDY